MLEKETHFLYWENVKFYQESSHLTYTEAQYFTKANGFTQSREWSAMQMFVIRIIFSIG